MSGNWRRAIGGFRPIRTFGPIHVNGNIWSTAAGSATGSPWDFPPFRSEVSKGSYAQNLSLGRRETSRQLRARFRTFAEIKSCHKADIGSSRPLRSSLELEPRSPSARTVALPILTLRGKVHQGFKETVTLAKDGLSIRGSNASWKGEHGLMGHF